jgi:hypothetical protein
MKAGILKLTGLTIAVAALFVLRSTVVVFAEDVDEPPVTEDDFGIIQNAEGGITITGYTGEARQVAIPTTITGVPVTAIADGAFRRIGLTRVSIPNSVTSIGEEAFADNELTEITLPDSLHSIGDSAFVNNKIIRLALPASLTSIGRIAFENNRIARLVLPASLRTIYGGTFRNNRLTTVIIPEGIASLPNRYPPFAKNPLINIVIPRSLKSFARSFEGLPIAYITLPDNVNEANLEQFGESFVDYYASQGKKAGTYVYDGRIWTARY